jgi:hypothetical protein
MFFNEKCLDASMIPQRLTYRNSYSFSKPKVIHNAHFRYERCLDVSMLLKCSFTEIVTRF